MGCSASRFDTLIEKAFENSLTSPATSSNPKKNSSFVSETRSLATPSVHHPALRKGDTHHVVCLTSTTYGSLFNAEKDGFSLSRASSSPDSVVSVRNGGVSESEKEEKTSPDSVINAWELMQGLEDDENGCGNQFKVKSVSLCDFNDDEMLNLVDDDGCSDFKAKSFNFCDFVDAQKLPVSKLDIGLIDCSSDFKVKSWNSCDFNDAQKLPNSKPGRNLPDSRLGRLGVNSVDCGSDFKVRSSKSELNLNKSLMKMSDSYVFVEIPSEIIEEDEGNTKPLWKHLSEESLLSKMDLYVGSPYERALTGQKSVGSSPFHSKTTYISPNSPLLSKFVSEDKIVLYFTSLRSIRKTYENCSTVRMILKGFRVVVDERDISMDSSFRKELQSALVGKPMSLPQLFIRGKHIGGADDVKLLHETGELESILEGCPTKDCGYVCRVCGDARFLPCSNCYGSRKIFLEEEGQTRKCPDCNENGLVRCPDCCP